MNRADRTAWQQLASFGPARGSWSVEHRLSDVMTGISTLPEGKKHGASVGVELHIVIAAGSAPRRSLDIAGLLEVLAGCPTLSAVLDG
jgi:hypothetical protein